MNKLCNLRAPTDASAETITVTLTDHNSTTFSVAIASTFNSADSARTVACDFVSAANALFSAQGVSYNAYETSAGEVKLFLVILLQLRYQHLQLL